MTKYLMILAALVVMSTACSSGTKNSTDDKTGVDDDSVMPNDLQPDETIPDEMIDEEFTDETENSFTEEEPVDDGITDPDEDEVSDEEAENDTILPDNDEQIDADLADIQPDPDMVDSDAYDDWVPDTTDVPPDIDMVDDDMVDIDTYDDWVPDTVDVQLDLDMVDEDLVDEDTVDVDIVPDADTVVSGVLCTGQTKCYNDTSEITCPAPGSDFYGQDYQYSLQLKCMPRSYTVSGGAGADVVTDNNTGLVWQRTVGTTTYTWANAITYCENLSYGGYTDWRLPTRKELATLPDYGRYNPAIDTTIFPGTQFEYYYWTSSPYADDSTAVWTVHFGVGLVNYPNFPFPNHARCVRGDALSDSAFTEETVSGKVIVTDTVTGLQWTKEYSSSVKWQSALAYCETLNYGGYDDWRLPNIEELKTLIEDSIYTPASTFPGMPSDYFWSSSAREGNAYETLSVGFNYGNVNSSDKNYNYYARCVR